METLALVIILGVFLLVFVFIMRFIGSWMFRIDDVIKELKEIRSEISKKN